MSFHDARPRGSYQFGARVPGSSCLVRRAGSREPRLDWALSAACALASRTVPSPEWADAGSSSTPPLSGPRYSRNLSRLSDPVDQPLPFPHFSGVFAFAIDTHTGKSEPGCYCVAYDPAALRFGYGPRGWDPYVILYLFSVHHEPLHPLPAFTSSQPSRRLFPASLWNSVVLRRSRYVRLASLCPQTLLSI